MRRQRKKRSCVPVLILISLTLLLASCQSSPVEVEPIPIEIEWPYPPDPVGQVQMRDGIIYMPLEYWLQLAEYVVDVERVRRTYETLEK